MRCRNAGASHQGGYAGRGGCPVDNQRIATSRGDVKSGGSTSEGRIHSVRESVGRGCLFNWVVDERYNASFAAHTVSVLRCSGHARNTLIAPQPSW